MSKPICPSCFEPLGDSGHCIHGQRYLGTLQYVRSQGILVTNHDVASLNWQGADAQSNGYDRYIRISSEAYKLYGWDVMTSILIHELGHCALFSEGVAEGCPGVETLEVEKLANRRGLDMVPPDLVPEAYQQHREFFLRSHQEKDWTEEKCRSEWRLFQEKLLSSDQANSNDTTVSRARAARAAG